MVGVRWRITAAYAGLCVVWGSAWAATQMVTEEVPAFRASALRSGSAAAGLLTACAVRWVWRRGDRNGLRSGGMNARTLKASLVLGVTMMAGPTGLLLWAAPRISTATTLLLFSVLPLVTAAMAPLFSRGGAPRMALEAALLGAGGMALAIQSALRLNWQEAGGAAAVLTAVLLQAGSLLYAKRQLAGTDLLASTAMQLALAALLFGGASAVLHEGHASHPGGNGWILLIFIGLVETGTSYLLYYRLLRELEPWQVATVSWITTFVAIAEGAVLLHEGITVSMGLGSAAVFASLAMIMRARNEDDAPVTLKVTGGAGER